MPADFDLVVLSHLRWDFVYQRPQHLLSRAAKERRVFFIEEPVFGADRAHMDVSHREDGLYVVVPQLRDDQRDDQEEVQRELLDGLFLHERIQRYALWYYTPMAMAFTRHLKPAAVIYDCMDELSAFKDAPPVLLEREAELFERADVVFTGGQTLYEAKKDRHPNVHAFPSSIEVEHFSLARYYRDEPDDQARIPHPRLGFAGVIDERMDLDLIAGVADLRPDWHIVLVGPIVKIDPEALPKRPNIHLLGGKPYAQLPAFLASWDVAIMPFARNESTRFISPTKTPEYLAAGRPVVSTTIRDVVRPYGERGMVHIADTPEEFVAAVEVAMAEDASARQKAVDAFLAQGSWDKTWQRMTGLIDVAVRLRARREGVPVASSEALEEEELAELAEIVQETTSLTPPAVWSPVNGRAAYDYLIVGAGFAGSVLAERLAGSGKKVLLVDRRPHIGGNAYDCYNDDGILIHLYGPHIFHTNSARVFDYLSQFTKWRPYEHRVLASVDGHLLPIPINMDTVNSLYGLNLRTEEDVQAFYDSRAEPVDHCRTSEDVVVSKVGRELYEKFFRGYTRKQWGLDPSELDAQVTARVPTRTNRDDRYFTDTYQYMPLHGYTRMFENMLSHPNINIMLNTDYRELEGLIPYKEMIFTGPVDQFFDNCYGKLPYRSLEFEHKTVDADKHLPVAVVNYPNEHAYTRVTEFKHLTGQEHTRTGIVFEYPRAEGDPYYPIPKPECTDLYSKYKTLADATKGVHFVGRLATYKYYNMDQVVGQALMTFDKITGVKEPRSTGAVESRSLTANETRPNGSAVPSALQRQRNQ